MTDFETHPVGTAARIKQLEADAEMMFAKGMSHGQQVLKDTGRLVIVDSPELIELREALTRSNAATAAAFEVVSKQLEASRETFCYASPGSDEEFTSLLLGFDTAAGIIRALATPDQTAALDRLIAEAVKPLINAADAMLDAFCVHEDSAQIATSAGMINAILAASKKGGV